MNYKHSLKSVENEGKKRQSAFQTHEEEVRVGRIIGVTCVFLVLIAIAGAIAYAGINFSIIVLSLGGGTNIHSVLYGVFSLGVFLSFTVVFVLHILLKYFL